MDKHTYGQKLSKKIATEGKSIGKFQPYYEDGILAWVKEGHVMNPHYVVFATPLYAPKVCGETIVVTKGTGDGDLIKFDCSGNLNGDMKLYYELVEKWFEENMN